MADPEGLGARAQPAPPTPEQLARGERILRARLAAGFIVAAEFCRRANISQPTLWRYEHGQMAPSSENLLRLASALGVSADWLWSGTGVGPADESGNGAAATG